MAKIWPVYEGRDPTGPVPWAELPVAEAIELFELKPDDFVSDLVTTPRFGDKKRDLWYLGYRHVVVEIGKTEARHTGFKPGFYRSRIKPKDAFERLVRSNIVPELGAKNVLRIESDQTTDSQGRNAVRITVVIAPTAMRKFAKDAPLNALVRVHELVDKIRDEPTPILEYATEAELKQNGAA